MPVREVPLITDEYYHIYNRGVAKQNIFLSDRYYVRFERTIDYYKYASRKKKFSRYLLEKFKPEIARPVLRPNQVIPQVELVAYCLMPNHFHMILRQLLDDGISNFMRCLANSYTRYFNTVKQRVGPIFQGQFKAKLINGESYLLHLSRYIHLNPNLTNLVQLGKLSTYKYSSLCQYISGNPSGTLLVNPRIVTDQFGNNKLSYKNFCFNTLDYHDSIKFFGDVLIDIND